ncbi:uncharacterized protein BDZ99DRAFT_474115 [Mytilinidion resinicola]|uniref:Zn(2)-C6 fungal-type domain-containing protein n=1 Tax=Mytilinidion resinicola TaxID=574789 RepID=A0A6A6YX09_9PEZI|nr:uncharacterized protein BDZ99DRAFT_474115 [Mytilinidion resinicola]KAF2813466.1 hypothetical protein BDZ99DRAFT_474115 [Mytilinidion resinicola]
MAEQNPSQARQQSQSYPSPHSYPSPSMQPTYTYPPPQGQQSQEPYRASPTGSSMSLPSLNLPPIRLQDGHGQPPPQHQPGQQPMGSPLPPPVQPMSAYYPNPNQSLPPPGQQMNVTSSPHQLAMRYQLPPHQGEQRMMSGGRHKKEIKRRTKTGCLTCRKRRIKCDEAHPTCRNCQKSKRDCLGYDPIFKQQPGPAQIQPAPSAAQLQPSIPASAPPPSGSYAHVPQGYAPAVTAGYAPPPTSGGHPPYDQFNSAIDPALAATDPALQGGPPPYNGSVPPSFRPAVGSASPYSSIASDVHPVKAKRIKISDTFSTNGHAPPEVPPRTGPITEAEDSELTEVYTKDYVNGLCHILETDWFITNNNGLHRIMNDKDLHEEALFFVMTCRSYDSQRLDLANQITSQEIRLVWRFLCVCRQSLPSTNGINGSTSIKEEDDLPVREARGRLDVLEALLTNNRLESNPLLRISYPANIDQAKKAQVDFWAHLGDFVVNVDNESTHPDTVERSLSAMRDILQQIEARDVIYSIAIARVAGNRVPGFPHNLPPPRSNDPNDDVNKLNIARGFITDESKASTQQVITRICEMALTSWRVSR